MISYCIFWLLRFGVHPVNTDLFIIAALFAALYAGYITAKEDMEDEESEEDGKE